MDLPMEDGQLLAQRPVETCGSALAPAFSSLMVLSLAHNNIEGIYAGPFEKLQTFDISNNRLTYMHPDWSP
eukprot:1359828-Amphidinium_carterae.1